MTHEEETANFLGDPYNGYCEECFCSWFYVDDGCACECHESPDFADGEDWDDPEWDDDNWCIPCDMEDQ